MMLLLKSKNDLPVKDNASHVANMGRMIEDMEAKMRNQLQVSMYTLSLAFVSDFLSFRIFVGGLFWQDKGHCWFITKRRQSRKAKASKRLTKGAHEYVEKVTSAMEGRDEYYIVLKCAVTLQIHCLV